MPNVSLTRVNQKLAQAKVLLAQAKVLLVQAKVLLAGVDENTLTPVHLSSLQEAAAFHLMCAYQHYLREIAETYWLKNAASINTEADLNAAFQAAKKHPVEAEELIALRSNLSSWLWQLNTYYESLWGVPVVVKNEPLIDSHLIHVVHIETNFTVDQVDVALITAWHENFMALVIRHRETSAEF